MTPGADAAAREPAHPAPEHRLEAAAALTREDVIAAFELLLGRQPEGEAAIAHHLTHADRVALGAAIRRSSEFRFRHALDRREPARPAAAASARATRLAQYRFGQAEDTTSLRRFGWSEPDRDDCWTIGRRSELALTLPPVAAGQALAVTLRLRPFIGPQRLSVEIAGVTLASVLATGPLSLSAWLRPDLIAGCQTVLLTLRHPDAKRPCDHSSSTDQRHLAFAVEALDVVTLPQDAATIEDAEMLLQFQSLGDNCEFGFVQRRLGSEPTGLLRFNTMPMPALMRALSTGFADFPNRALMRLERHTDRTGGTEIVVFEDGCKLSGHTTVVALDSLDSPEGEATLLDREQARLRFLKRVLLAELAGSETIFVYKRNATPDEAEIVALWLALRALGGCTLLWVVPAEPGAPAGSVSILADGLLKGHVERLAPYDNAEDVALDSWLTVCRRAYRISRAGLAAPTG